MMITEKGRAKRVVIKVMALMLIFFISLNILGPCAVAENSPPTLTKGTVTPRKSYPNIDYTYSVIYTDADNDAPSYVRVNIDGVDYDMDPVDPTDTNYTDGRDYSVKKVMSEGSYTVYYVANDGNGSEVKSDPFTLSVTWDVGHFDIIHFIEEEVFPGVILLLAVLIIMVLVLCVILIFTVLQLRRIARGLERGREGEEGSKVKDETAGEEEAGEGEEKPD
ncbi:MAG: hypothetical protein JSW28_00245 [Thermoplasmata archaeon]|nr:MAG: hypothetical protein JSW28_00245 [Thermoplasmata archaeon]